MSDAKNANASGRGSMDEPPLECMAAPMAVCK